jgi:hypothetical protein
MGSSQALAIEKAPFTVIEKEGSFELRRYPAYIVAETYVDGSFDEVGNEGFRRLAGYIGGKNRKNTSIAMTAPVSQTDASEKIAMTAPVSQSKTGNRWRVTFMMPSEYTLQSLPQPEDERINLVIEPARVIAVIRYSGTWSQQRYSEHEAKLIEWIEQKGWRRAGSPVWSRYDPPFMPWFLRRNEIMIPLNVQSYPRQAETTTQ